MKVLINWDNKTWLSSNTYINSFNSFLLKKKKLNKNSKILDIGCGRGKIFGSISRKLRLINKPIGIDPVCHNDVDRSIDFKNEDIFFFLKNNNNKFDLIMIKQTLHFINKNKRSKLIEKRISSVKFDNYKLSLEKNNLIFEDTISKFPIHITTSDCKSL